MYTALELGLKNVIVPCASFSGICPCPVPVTVRACAGGLADTVRMLTWSLLGSGFCVTAWMTKLLETVLLAGVIEIVAGEPAPGRTLATRRPMTLLNAVGLTAAKTPVANSRVNNKRMMSGNTQRRVRLRPMAVVLRLRLGGRLPRSGKAPETGRPCAAAAPVPVDAAWGTTAVPTAAPASAPPAAAVAILPERRFLVGGVVAFTSNGCDERAPAAPSPNFKVLRVRPGRGAGCRSIIPGPVELLST